MAGITSDLLASMLKTNLNELKSFAELLNAELAENFEDNDNRDSQKRDMLKILHEFGEAEAIFEKGKSCLQKVERVVKESCTFNCPRIVDEDAVFSEIKSALRSLDSKEKTQDFPDDRNLDADGPGFGLAQLEEVEDVLVAMNRPIILSVPHDEGYDSNEERQVVEIIEERERAVLANQDDDQFRPENLSFFEGGNGINIAPNSYERIQGSLTDDTNVQSDKVNELQKAYEDSLIREAGVCARQLYDSQIGKEADVDFERLSLLPKYKDSILELFNKDAIVVLEKKQDYIDPISKTAIQNPVRNKICDHVYERTVVYNLLKTKKAMACPCLGCSCRMFSAKDLVEDEEVAAKISHSQARAREIAAQAAEDAETDDEVGPEDDTQSQEIL